MVVDIQGVGDLYTDPQILTATGRDKVIKCLKILQDISRIIRNKISD